MESWFNQSPVAPPNRQQVDLRRCEGRINVNHKVILEIIDNILADPQLKVET